MQFTTQLTILGFAAAALANSVTFINQDSTKRLIVITPSAGHAEINSVEIAGHDQAKVEFPHGWIGNAYSVSEGAENIPGMLAEVTFQGWDDITYFDVSAIVDPNDHNGVKEMYPASELNAKVKSLYSGCKKFPCNTAYYLPDDVQTVTTTEVDIICTLGNSDNLESRETESHYVSRNYVLGKL